MLHLLWIDKIIIVLYSADPPSPPIISGYTEGSIIPAGSVQKLLCVSAGGNPLATLTWYKNDKKVSIHFKAANMQQWLLVICPCLGKLWFRQTENMIFVSVALTAQHCLLWYHKQYSASNMTRKKIKRNKHERISNMRRNNHHSTFLTIYIILYKYFAN